MDEHIVANMIIHPAYQQKRNLSINIAALIWWKNQTPSESKY